MRLRDYLRERGETVYAFAKRSGIPEPTAHRIFHGTGASVQNLLLVIEATGGQVALADLAPHRQGVAEGGESAGGTGIHDDSEHAA